MQASHRRLLATQARCLSATLDAFLQPQKAPGLLASIAEAITSRGFCAQTVRQPRLWNHSDVWQQEGQPKALSSLASAARHQLEQNRQATHLQSRDYSEQPLRHMPRTGERRHAHRHQPVKVVPSKRLQGDAVTAQESRASTSEVCRAQADSTVRDAACCLTAERS